MKDLIQLLKIGKELGLSKKEVSKVLFFDNNKNRVIFLIFLIIIFSIAGYFIILIIKSTVNNTYPSGTRYSTVKIKDFDKKK
ncbi:MAG: hypothetical protein HWN79_12965 [Candidatus Lokiarchaeota archaeon]|nr:hypothetical protein [Candidatus Lokiarchaeota archaeon]